MNPVKSLPVRIAKIPNNAPRANSGGRYLPLKFLLLTLSLKVIPGWLQSYSVACVQQQPLRVVDKWRLVETSGLSRFVVPRTFSVSILRHIFPILVAPAFQPLFEKARNILFYIDNLTSGMVLVDLFTRYQTTVIGVESINCPRQAIHSERYL